MQAAARGSWFSEPHLCRAALRGGNHPAHIIAIVGFRPCCLLPPGLPSWFLITWAVGFVLDFGMFGMLGKGAAGASITATGVTASPPRLTTWSCRVRNCGPPIELLSAPDPQTLAAELNTLFCRRSLRRRG
jgi:hypothetical protein